jgi:hypothetical protein
MFRRRLLALGLAVVAVFHPGTGFGMVRADMDRLLTLARRVEFSRVSRGAGKGVS